MGRKKIKTVVLLFLFLLWSAAMLFAGYRFERSQTASKDATVSMVDFFYDAFARSPAFPKNLLGNVFDRIDNEFLHRPADTTKLFYGAIKGIVASLDDPYSVFLDPESASLFGETIDGSFEGIGAEIGIKDEVLTIIAPLPGSPAMEAGLQTGDRVLAIDDLDTRAMTLDEAVSRIRGEKGTSVVLMTLRGEGQDGAREVSIVRGTIEVSSIAVEQLEGNITHINIYSFNAHTVAEFSAIENDLLVHEPQGVVLDLRGNPGGFLSGAVELAGSFLEKGTVVVYEDFGNGERKPYMTTGAGRLSGIPLVVLVDQGSASAAEILAGALIDHQVATAIGMTTFGKGTVQNYNEFPDGSALKLTVARWLTPNEHVIEGEGITPEVVVEITQEDYDNDRDPQLDAAVRLLKEHRS